MKRHAIAEAVSGLPWVKVNAQVPPKETIVRRDILHIFETPKIMFCVDRRLSVTGAKYAGDVRRSILECEHPSGQRDYRVLYQLAFQSGGWEQSFLLRNITPVNLAHCDGLAAEAYARVR